MYDVAIIGGSFAGLATAMQLCGHRVLIVDQSPTGSHQMSSYGTHGLWQRPWVRKRRSWSIPR
jgi:2-polyprenyl-6-methoxyphenol hydroxylase-like FAD-dependent oxidoreductase